jgi:hypothetical protein
LPTELWNLEEWPSPAPEAVVRSRVRGRARSILRLRVAVAAVAASLAVVVGLTDLPAPGSGVRMRTDSPWQPADQPVETEVEHGAPAVAPPALVRAIDSAHAVMLPPPVGPVEGGEPVPVTESMRGPSVLDALGDAHYQTCRGVDCPPETGLDRASPSQALFDFTTVGFFCSASVYEAWVNIADLDATPTPNRAGLTPTDGLFHVGLRFKDAQQTMITLGVHHALASKTSSVGGTVSLYDGDEFRSAFLKPRVRRVGDAFLVQLTREELAAAVAQASAGALPPPDGTPFAATGMSMAMYRDPVLTSDVVDEIPLGSQPTRWCG